MYLLGITRSLKGHAEGHPHEKNPVTPVKLVPGALRITSPSRYPSQNTYHESLTIPESEYISRALHDTRVRIHITTPSRYQSKNTYHDSFTIPESEYFTSADPNIF